MREHNINGVPCKDYTSALNLTTTLTLTHCFYRAHSFHVNIATFRTVNDGVTDRYLSSLMTRLLARFEDRTDASLQTTTCILKTLKPITYMAPQTANCSCSGAVRHIQSGCAVYRPWTEPHAHMGLWHWGQILMLKMQNCDSVEYQIPKAQNIKHVIKWYYLTLYIYGLHTWIY